MAKNGYIGDEGTYRAVEYIQSSRAQYIDTGFKPKYNTRVVMDAQGLDKSAQWLFGARDTNSSSSPNQFALYRPGSTSMRSDYFGSNASVDISDITVRTVYDKNGANTSFYDKQIKNTAVSSGECSFPLYLFTHNNMGTAHANLATIKLYSCKIYDNGTLVRDFVPCINEIGEAGLYDKANGVFYRNAGSGEFASGAETGEMFISESVAREVSKVYIGIDHSLPSGYTPIEYIQSSGTQYIDTGFKANQDTKVVMRVALTAVMRDEDAFFGGRTTSTSKAYMLSYNSDSSFYRYFYGNSYYTTALTGDPMTKQVIIYDKNTVTIGNESYSCEYSTFQCDYTLYLLALNKAGQVDRNVAAKLYSCRIYDNGTLIRDFVPCTNASGVAGLYDTVNGVFYTDAAGGAFSAGASVSPSVARKIVKAYIGDENGIARRWLPSGLSASDLAVGSSVFMNVGGVRTEFIVVHQGNPSATYYDASCNGTWVLMKDIYEERAWDSRYTNLGYSSSDIHVYLRDQFIGLFDVNIQSAIKQVKIPYRTNSGSGGTSKWLADGLKTKIFLLGGNEVGFTNTIATIGDDGVKLDYFMLNSSDADRIAYFNGVAKGWHLRTPAKTGAGMNYVNLNGSCSDAGFINKMGIRPAFILPSDTSVDKDMNVLA